MTCCLVHPTPCAGDHIWGSCPHMRRKAAVRGLDLQFWCLNRPPPVCFPVSAVGAGPDRGLQQTKCPVKTHLLVQVFAHPGNLLADWVTLSWQFPCAYPLNGSSHVWTLKDDPCLEASLSFSCTNALPSQPVPMLCKILRGRSGIYRAI